MNNFLAKNLQIYTDSGKKMKTLLNCEYGFERSLMTSGFSYQVSPTEKRFINKSKNFIYFNTLDGITAQPYIKEMNHHYSLYIDGELFYEGKGYHYLSPHEALNAFYFFHDGEFYVINHSDNISEDAFFLIEEKLINLP